MKAVVEIKIKRVEKLQKSLSKMCKEIVEYEKERKEMEY